MDPLSFTASLIAIITLTGTVTTSLNELRNILKDAPDDLLTLLDEVKDFQAVLSGIRDIGPESFPDAFLELSTIPSRATDKLRELERILHHKILLHVPATGAKPEVPKLRWLRVRGRIGAIRQDLRDLRLQLVTALTGIMATRTLAAHTRLETIEISLKELGSGQRTIITEMNKSMALALPSPNALIPGSYSHKAGQKNEKDDVSMIRTESFCPGISLSSNEITDRQITVPINAPLGYEWQCDPWCACLCHKRQRWQMPTLLHNLLGDLYLGYSGSLFSKTECTETMCRRSPPQNTKLIFRLPPWLAARVIMADLGGPSPSLRAARVVGWNAPIFQCSENGDVEGIKMLFRSGLASPWDVDPIGWTPLLYALKEDGKAQLDACRFLLQAGSDLSAEPTVGHSPISLALHYGLLGHLDHYEVFPLWDAIPEQGYTRLHKIILGILPGKVETELAISTSDIDTPDILGQTPLSWAVTLEKYEIVQLLLKSKANVNLADIRGLTPLMTAALHGLPSHIDALVNAGADLHAVHSVGITALSCVRFSKSEESLRRLMYHESKLEMKSELYLGLEANGYGARDIEDITDGPDSAEESAEDVKDLICQSNVDVNVEDSDVEDAEDFADALETLNIQPSPDAPVPLEKLVSLVRPGGHLQWFGPLPLSARMVNTDPECAAPATDRLIIQWRNSTSTTAYNWVEGLPEEFRSQGLEAVVVDRVKMLNRCRLPWEHSQLATIEDLRMDVVMVAGLLGGKEAEKVEALKVWNGQLKEEFVEGARIIRGL